MENLIDDADSLAPGRSFIDDKGNPGLQRHKNDLLLHISQNPGLRERLFEDSPSGELALKKRSALMWLNDCSEFMATLAGLARFTRGGPARGAELASITLREARSARRSACAVDIRLLPSATHSKGRSLEGRDTLVTRCAADRAQKIMMKHLMRGRAMEAVVASSILGSEAASACNYGVFAKQGRVMTGQDAGSSISACLSQCFSLDFGMLGWRRIFISFQGKRIRC